MIDDQSHKHAELVVRCELAQLEETLRFLIERDHCCVRSSRTLSGGRLAALLIKASKSYSIATIVFMTRSILRYCPLLLQMRRSEIGEDGQH